LACDTFREDDAATPARNLALVVMALQHVACSLPIRSASSVDNLTLTDPPAIARTAVVE